MLSDDLSPVCMNGATAVVGACADDSRQSVREHVVIMQTAQNLNRYRMKITFVRVCRDCGSNIRSSSSGMLRLFIVESRSNNYHQHSSHSNTAPVRDQRRWDRRQRSSSLVRVRFFAFVRIDASVLHLNSCDVSRFRCSFFAWKQNSSEM